MRSLGGASRCRLGQPYMLRDASVGGNLLAPLAVMIFVRHCLARRQSRCRGATYVFPNRRWGCRSRASHRTRVVTGAGSHASCRGAYPPLHRPVLLSWSYVQRDRRIGGDVPNADPTYAFHTPYIPRARGWVNFTVHVQHMTAKVGNLVLRVHMLDDDSGLPARMATSERIQLNRLSAIGEVSVALKRFVARPTRSWGS